MRRKIHFLPQKDNNRDTKDRKAMLYFNQKKTCLIRPVIIKLLNLLSSESRPETNPATSLNPQPQDEEE